MTAQHFHHAGHDCTAVIFILTESSMSIQMA